MVFPIRWPTRVHFESAGRFKDKNHGKEDASKQEGKLQTKEPKIAT